MHVTAGLSLRFRGAVAFAVRATLAFVVLGFSPLGLVEAFEAPKIALVRAVGLGALAAVLAARRARSAVCWNAVDFAVLVWLAVEIAATLVSVAPRISLLGSPWQHEGLLTSVALAGIYVGLRFSHRSLAAFRLTLGVFLAAAAVACLYALAQAAHLDPMPWARTAAYGGGYVRPFGTLGHPNLLGGVAATACVTAVALSLGERRRRGWWAAVVLLGAAAAVASLSRAAWIALPLGTALAGALVWSGSGTLRLSRRALAIGGVLAALLAAALATGNGGRLLAARAAELLSGSTGSGASRVEIWRAALAAWQARPWLGHGPDTFELVYPGFQTPAYWRLEWLGTPFHAHSIVLHTLATRGVAGLLAALCVAGTLAWAWWRTGRDGADARGLRAPFLCASAAVVVYGMFGAAGINGALVFLLTAAFLAVALEGVPAGAARAARSAAEHRSSKAARSHGRAKGRRTPGSWLAAGCGLAVSLFVTWAEVIDMRASYFARGAEVLASTAPAEAIVAARLAIRTLPFEDLYERYHVDAARALAATVTGRNTLLDEAERAARRAVALTPRQPGCHLRLAAVYADRAELGDSTAVAPMEAAFRSVLRLAPVDVMARVIFAQTELRLGRPNEALALAGEAVRIDSTWAPPYAITARARIGLGDLDGARTALSRSLRADWRGNAAARADAEQQLRSLGGTAR
jgi:putative inorganic carbon (HCO3(-)) transporter